MTMIDLDKMADTLSLTVNSADDRLLIHRLGRDLTVSPNPLATIDGPGTRNRHVAFCILTGARLGLDRLCSTFEPGQAKKTPSRPVRYHEQPSIYGERMPRLLPRLAVRWFEAICDDQAFVTEWELPEFRQVYVLETGKTLHTLAVRDVPLLDTPPDKIRRNGRHALFYDSYKLKPREKLRYSGGTVRIFRTVEGLGASRAVLLPDFDYDAAREGGSFAIPSRDIMIIGRPDDPEDADDIAAEVTRAARSALEDALFPLCNRVWRMTDKTIDGSVAFGDIELPVSDWERWAPGAFDVSTSTTKQ
jgi:hypothetical protein